MSSSRGGWPGPVKGCAGGLVLAGVVASLLVGCDQNPASCVPSEIQRAAATLNERGSAAAAPRPQPAAGEVAVQVYLDFSESMRGYLRGANCAGCIPEATVQGPLGVDGRPAAARARPGPGRPARDDGFYDPLFATLLRNLTIVPLKALPGTKVHYHLFSAQVSPEVEEDVISKIAQDDQCYRGRKPKNYKECFFDRDNAELRFGVGSRSISPIGNVFEEIKRLDTPRSLYIIASDLFFSNGEVSELPGSAVSTLAALIKRGFGMSLYGFKVPFTGNITDTPLPTFPMAGRLPFYFLVLGDPAAVAAFGRELRDAALQIKVAVNRGGPPQPLAQTALYNAFSLGNGDGGRGAVLPEVEFSSLLEPSAARLVESPLVQRERTVPIAAALSPSGAPVTLRWQLPAGGAGQPGPTADDFQQSLSVWRRNNSGASGGAACAGAWTPVSANTLVPSALTATRPQVLESRLLGGGVRVEPSVTYLIQAMLYRKRAVAASSPVEPWIADWSCDANSVSEVVRGAVDGRNNVIPGSFVRTYNLKDFMLVLERAADTRGSQNFGLVSQTVMAIKVN